MRGASTVNHSAESPNVTVVSHRLSMIVWLTPLMNAVPWKRAPSFVISIVFPTCGRALPENFTYPRIFDIFESRSSAEDHCCSAGCSTDPPVCCGYLVTSNTLASCAEVTLPCSLTGTLPGAALSTFCVDGSHAVL